MSDSDAALASAWLVAGTMAEILLVVLVGTMGAYFGIIPAHMRKELSGLCMNLLLPPFLFIKLSRSVNLSLLHEWWLIPVFVVLNLIIGFALGLAVEKMLMGRVQKSMAGTFLVACGVGNAGTIPMAVMYSVCDQNLAKFAEREGSCTDDALAMISLGIAVAAGFFWTFGPSLLKGRNQVEQALEGHGYAEMEEQREERPEEEEQKACTACSSLPHSIIVEAAAGNNSGVPHHEAEALQQNSSDSSSSNNTKIAHSISANSCTTQPHTPGTTPPSSSSSSSCIDALRSCAKGAKAFLNSASIAVFAGLVCGCIPPFKSLLHGPDAPLHTITSSMEMIGSSVIPLMLLVLGANLLSSGQQGGQGRLDPLVAFAVTAVRLILLPLIGMLLIHVLKLGGLLGTDPLLEFVLLIQVSIYGNAKEMSDAAQLALYQYLFATPLLTAALTVYTTVQL